MKWNGWLLSVLALLWTVQTPALAGCRPYDCEKIVQKISDCVNARQNWADDFQSCRARHELDIMRYCICPPPADDDAPTTLMDFNALGVGAASATPEDDFLCVFCFRNPMVDGCSDVRTNCR